MSQKIKLSEKDERLAHIVGDHLLAAYRELLISITEATMVSNDERFENLLLDLEVIIETLDDTVNNALDTIPGTLSREEADEKSKAYFERQALLDGLPIDAYLPENTPLQ